MKPFGQFSMFDKSESVASDKTDRTIEIKWVQVGWQFHVWIELDGIRQKGTFVHHELLSAISQAQQTVNEKYLQHVEPVAKIADPRKENSRAARLKKLPSMSSDKGKILRCLMNYGGDMHCKHIAQLSGLDYHAVARRMKSLLEDDQLIEITGKRDGMTTYKKK